MVEAKQAAVKSTVEGNLKILDTLRGFASIYVLVGHARWLLWEGYNFGYKMHPGDYNLLDKASMYFFSVFQFGHQSVLFFFVLSGFVIHWSTSKRFNKTGEFKIGDYLFRRIKRIYPPLIAAIVITFAVDQFGLLQNLPIYFSHTLYPSINENINPVLNWKTLIGNLTFVQTVYTPVWGTDGPLWSLMYEWWFYVLYIPIIWLFNKNRTLTSLLVLIVWIISLEFPFSPLLLSMVLKYFIAWYIGMLLADFLLNNKISIKQPIVYLAAISLLAFFRYKDGIGMDILLAVGIVVLLYALLTTNAFKCLSKLHKLGEFSYTLYIIHVPIICLLSGYILQHSHRLPVHSGFVICGIAVSAILAWGLHLVTERPFTRKSNSKS